MTEQENPWLVVAAANRDELEEVAREAAATRTTEAAESSHQDPSALESATTGEPQATTASTSSRRAGRLSAFTQGRRPITPEPVTTEAAPRRRSRFHSTVPEVSENPFLPSSPAQQVDADAGDHAPVMVSGPAAPTGAPAPADPLLTLPQRFDRARAQPGLLVQVVALHGGAGASTVASLLGKDAIDCGVGLGRLVDPTVPVVLVARTHGHGLHLVRRVAAQWASGGLQSIALLGIVLVDDAPNLSKALHRETKSALRTLPTSWRLSWSEEIRHDPNPPGEPSGGRLRRVRKSLLDQARKLSRENTREKNTTTLMEGTA